MSNASNSTPTVFISAATIDLKQWRDLLDEAFRAAQFRVLVQDSSLGVATGNVRDHLVDAIEQSDCVIHLAGLGYGSHAQSPFPDAPHFRCSWTQFEYYYAHLIGKKVIAFVCAASLSHFQREEEGDLADRLVKEELQKVHCKRVMSGEFVGTPWEGQLGRTLNEPQISDVGKLLTTIAAAVGKLQREHPAYGVAANSLHDKLKRLAEEQIKEIERVNRTVIATGHRQIIWFGMGAMAISALVAFGLIRIDWGNREVVQAIHRMSTPALLGERIRKEIRDAAEARVKAIPEGVGRGLEIARIENERDTAISRVGELVKLLEHGLREETDATFQRAAEILEKEGTEAAIQYLESRRPSTMEDLNVLARKAAEAQAYVEKLKQSRNEKLIALIFEADLLETKFRLEEALPLRRLAAECAPDWHTTHSRLGQLLLTLGSFLEAERHLHTALVLSPAEEMATSLNNYSVALYKNRRAEASIALQKLAIEAEKKTGTDQRGLGQLLINLAESLRSLGKHADAEPLMRRAIELDEVQCGPSHPQIAYDLTILSGLLMDTNRNVEALALLRRAVAIASAGPEQETSTLPLALNCLAICLARKGGLHPQALSISLEAIRRDELLFGPSHPDLGRDLVNLAKAVYEASDHEGATCLLGRALEIWGASLDPSHPNIADACCNLAHVLSGTDESQMAEPLYRNALRIYVNNYGAIHPDVSATLRRLAQCVRSRVKDFQELEGEATSDFAELLLWRAMAINTTFYGQEYASMDEEHSQMYMFLKTTGRFRSPIDQGGGGESGEWIRIAASDEISRLAQTVPQKTRGLETEIDTQERLRELEQLAKVEVNESPLSAIDNFLGPTLTVNEVLQILRRRLFMAPREKDATSHAEVRWTIVTKIPISKPVWSGLCDALHNDSSIRDVLAVLDERVAGVQRCLEGEFSLQHRIGHRLDEIIGPPFVVKPKTIEKSRFSLPEL